MTEPWWAGAPPNPVGSPPQPSTGPRPTAQRSTTQQPTAQVAPWAPPPGAAPSGRTRVAQSAAVAGPTAPAPTMVGAPLQRKEPASPAATGLGILIFLLVVATFAAGVWLFGPGAVDWAVAIEPCLSGGGGWECIVNEDWRTSVLLPLVAMIAALCLARGAGIERRQSRIGLGFLYALLGFAALAAAWLVSAS